MKESDHAFDIYQKTWFSINEAVRSNLEGESEEVIEYVIERLSDEFRFWFIMEP